ncbi:trypsin-like peptidase domain-containing protein [Streptomyces sp. NBC_01498]|uniref:S1C family serine protease n=1 Tax=Streptomyces sp. NBC_01498 TaxID=2975870 RepID=UPI002E7AD997|nr:trypsin-like peptidase domain-containing protein [Streptomyces sp. NBC_01498]WTL24784.1 trypsin-like peptidase domain-containing protein [Streptomyces sp. NBC_01498]
MDDGKPTGPKAKWWSRPASGRAIPREPEAPEQRSTEDTTELSPVTDAVPPRPGGVPQPRPAESTSERAPGPGPEPDDGDHLLAPPARTPSTVDAAAGSTTGDTTTATTGTEPGPSTVSTAAATTGPGPAGGTESASGAPAGRPQPLHDPDPYSTPPYGGPGPWAPAPPVQRPVPTPAGGTPVPPGHYTGPADQVPPAPLPTSGYGVPPQGPPQGPGLQGPPQGPAPSPGLPPQDTAPRPTHWLQYDPWGAPGHQEALSYPDPGESRPGRRGVGLVGVLTLALCTAVIGGGVGAYIERNGGITSVDLPQAGRDGGNRPADSVAGIAASALPSVVTLHVSGGGEQGTGTGFVLDREGHILTNNHVVDPAGAAGDISITFSGGETATAKLVGKDSGYDLAVVKVTGVSGLKPLPLGNSDNVQVGDPVVAIGAPFDLQNTVTAGIISAKERPITAGGEKGDGSDVSYVDALQTDAPINPGNSGGPLVNSKAQVIGINSAIRGAEGSGTPDGAQAGSIGLGFAIPINQGKRVAEELINTGKASHPVIGVTLDMEYTGDGAKVGAKSADGGPSVEAGGPAAKAGVRTGDIITEVDGQRVHSGEELIVKIRAHRPGDELALTILRGGKERTMTLVLGSADGS